MEEGLPDSARSQSNTELKEKIILNIFLIILLIIITTLSLMQGAREQGKIVDLIFNMIKENKLK